LPLCVSLLRSVQSNWWLLSLLLLFLLKDILSWNCFERRGVILLGWKFEQRIVFRWGYIWHSSFEVRICREFCITFCR
jgi:hypothetical protein